MTYYVILEKSQVKGFTRTRKGRLERVNPFTRKGEKSTKLGVTKVNTSEEAKKVSKEWDKLYGGTNDIHITEPDEKVRVMRDTKGKLVAYINFELHDKEEMEDDSNLKLRNKATAYVSYANSHQKGAGRELFQNIFKEFPEIGAILLDAETPGGAKLAKKLHGEKEEEEGAYGYGTWIIYRSEK